MYDISFFFVFFYTFPFTYPISPFLTFSVLRGPITCNRSHLLHGLHQHVFWTIWTNNLELYSIENTVEVNVSVKLFSLTY